MTKPIL